MNFRNCTWKRLLDPLLWPETASSWRGNLQSASWKSSSCHLCHFRTLLLKIEGWRHNHMLSDVDPDFPRSQVDPYAAQKYSETYRSESLKHSWGKVQWPCSCSTYHPHYAFINWALLAALFDPAIKVPKDFIAVEPCIRKKCHRLEGTAGPTRLSLSGKLSNKKKKKASKIEFLEIEDSGKAAQS